MYSKKKMLAFVFMILLLSVRPVFAHDAPEGSEWIMADWMFLSFMIFAATAFFALIIALKRGWLNDIEGEAKHYILEIDEPDYYTVNFGDSEKEKAHG